MPLSAKEMLKLLKENGYEVISQNGSHVKLSNGERTIIVPNHGSKDLKKGLEQAILKQAGLK